MPITTKANMTMVANTGFCKLTRVNHMLSTLLFRCAGGRVRRRSGGHI